MRKLGVVGDLIEDVVVWLGEPLRYASDTRCRVHRARGGSAANVAAHAAGLVPTVFIGCVGADRLGDSLVAELAATGVEVRVQRRGTTGTAVILVDPDGERTMFPDRGAAGELRALDPVWTADLAHLHLAAYAFMVEPVRSTAIAAAEAVLAGGGTISVDASSTGVIADLGVEGLLQAVRELRARYFFANADEAAALDLFGQGRTAIGETTVIAKDGPRPTTVLEPGREPVRVAVPPVPEVRDLTGAGDAFAAGFLSAVLRGGTPVAAAHAGHRCAARVLGTPGSTGLVGQAGYSATAVAFSENTTSRPG
ncbi:MAG: PfkB family carbohydrate kinase [Actinobacteria bacterium]|nr:PfkB family carbohydrate kinase [Actinomycetota bacterium]